MSVVVTMRIIKGRPLQRNNARGNVIVGNNGGQNIDGNVNPGQAKPIKCYNYNGLGAHSTENVIGPKRHSRILTTSKERLLICKLQENVEERFGTQCGSILEAVHCDALRTLLMLLRLLLSNHVNGVNLHLKIQSTMNAGAPHYDSNTPSCGTDMSPFVVIWMSIMKYTRLCGEDNEEMYVQSTVSSVQYDAVMSLSMKMHEDVASTRIKILETQLQEKDNAIRNLKAQVTKMNDRSCETYNAKDVTALIEQNECVRVELEKTKSYTCGSSTYNADISHLADVSSGQEPVALPCYTQEPDPNSDYVTTTTPFELACKSLILHFSEVFGAMCYPTNDSEDLGKLQAKADIGIFVGYAPSRKGYRVYNKRTRRIMETIHVTFDELHQTMAPVRISSEPEPIMMTPG
ncbi:retrovirus-related pol polyprotein from transposon TNT 1-94 [Tanacetum coccineum]|uniref:Retrovirus-related pol polyprotein from transposon TNT 1-94 n=1 Tax=Tanacetum coccineum TaxID=301880 RepID=A0ABQ5B0A9_9ASTR